MPKGEAQLPTILEEAQSLVYGAREESYGHPFIDFSRTAKMWSALLDIDITPKQVALCMIALKLSRETNKHRRDNLVDAAGYAATAMRVEEWIVEHGSSG